MPLHGSSAVVSGHSATTGVVAAVDDNNLADDSLVAAGVVPVEVADAVAAGGGGGGTGGPPKHMLPTGPPARGSSSSSDCSVRPTRMTAPLTRMTLAPVATSVATSIDGVPISMLEDDDEDVEVDGIQLDDNIMGWNTRKQVNMTNIMPPTTRAFGRPPAAPLLVLAAAAAAAAAPDSDIVDRPFPLLSSRFGICKCGGN